jgi:hypothetical protein
MAKAGSMMRVLLAILRIRFWWIFALLVAAIFILAFGMGIIIQGAAESILIPFGLLAVVISWGLAKSRLKTWQVILIFAIIGILGLFIRIARLDVPSVNFIISLPLLNAKIILWLYDKTIPDLANQLEFLNDFTGRAGGLAIRLGEYAKGIMIGFNAYDLATRAFIWGFLIWLITGWSGWVLARGKNALMALAPAIILLAFISDYTGRGFLETWLLLLITITLMGLARYDAQARDWIRKGVDFSDSISWDTALAVGSVLIGVALITWFAPSISVKALVDTIRDWQKPQKNSIAESLGLVPPPKYGDTKPYVSPGLPQSHLLTGGPELEKTVALIISTGEQPSNPYGGVPVPVHRYYWRDVIFDIYTGSGWSSSPIENLNYDAGKELVDKPPPNYQVVQQTIKSLLPNENRVYWSGVLRSSNKPLQVAWRSKPGDISNDPLGGADMLGALIPVNEYKVESLYPQVSELQLRQASDNYPAWIQAHYMSLPAIPERVLSLARDVTASATTPYDRAKAIENYLRQIPYSLDVPSPPVNRDVADFFLFDLKKGYCDYYATAMVVMARATGLPARLVTGYATGTYDPTSATYIVTEANAHSWVEIYFPEYGWIEFEPTGAFPPIDLTGKNIVPPTPILPPAEGQSALAQAFSNLPEAAKYIATSLIGLLLILFIWTAIDKWWVFRRPVAAALTVIFKRMEHMGYRVSQQVRSTETPYEFSSLLQTQIKPYMSRYFPARFLRPAIIETEFITRLYVQAIFSQHMPAKSEALKAFAAWNNLRWRLQLVRFFKFLGKKNPWRGSGRKKSSKQ